MAYRVLNDQRPHSNIRCDSCGNAVKGFRYKCITCRDCDLCQACEGNSSHPEHFMIRISTPPMDLLGSRLARAIGEELLEPLRSARSTERCHADGQPSIATFHPGIKCDICKGFVLGYRYKCATCQDFDMCSTCEGKNTHSEHYVVRIPKPLILMVGMSRGAFENKLQTAQRKAWDFLESYSHSRNQSNTEVSSGNTQEGRIQRYETIIEGIILKEHGTQPESETTAEAAECMVCCEKFGSNHTLDPCGHAPACENCSADLTHCFVCDTFIVQEGDDDVHPGASCDSCRKPVKGYRYRCVTCYDYDLCHICEGKSLHSEHYMIRITAAKASLTYKLSKMIGQELMELHAMKNIDTDDFGLSNINCHVCGCTVEGFRYMCFTCVDYNLCLSCERKNSHKSHFMLRIPRPVYRQSRELGELLMTSLKIVEDFDKQRQLTLPNMIRADPPVSEASIADVKSGKLRAGTFVAAMKNRILKQGTAAEREVSAENRSNEEEEQREAAATSLNSDPQANISLSESAEECLLCSEPSVLQSCGHRPACQECFANMAVCPICNSISDQCLATEFTECMVCCLPEVKCVLEPCGHRPACEACCAGLVECPICDITIERRMRVDGHEIFNQTTAAVSSDAPSTERLQYLESLEEKMKEVIGEQNCGICMERPKIMAFQCGHSACPDCANKMTECPFCRVKIDIRIILY